jgi:hypothetical protein
MNNSPKKNAYLAEYRKKNRDKLNAEKIKYYNKIKEREEYKKYWKDYRENHKEEIKEQNKKKWQKEKEEKNENRDFKKVHWKKGLTKETDERVKNHSESLKKSYTSGKIETWNKGLEGLPSREITKDDFLITNNPARRLEVKEKLSISLKGNKNTVGVEWNDNRRKIMSSRMKVEWANPLSSMNNFSRNLKISQALSNVPKTQEHKEKLAIFRTGKNIDEIIKDPEKRKSFLEFVRIHWSGKNNPRWTGGAFPHYYGSNWNNQKRLARIRDNNICQMCNKIVKPNADVHHKKPFKLFLIESLLKNDTKIEYADAVEKISKEANDLFNLICLCKRCHRIEEWKINKQIPELKMFDDVSSSFLEHQ